MVNAPRPRQACVQFADPASAVGAEVSSPVFLEDCRRSALARFRSQRLTCRTIEHPVPPKPSDFGSTGLIVAHVSHAACRAWEAIAPGPHGRRAHVESQVLLALEELAAQDMHGYLAITDEQCAIYAPDLVQLLAEALDRTTFSRLGRQPDLHWEGTLVERVRPPYLVLVVSIGLAKPAPRRAARGRRRAGPVKPR